VAKGYRTNALLAYTGLGHYVLYNEFVVDLYGICNPRLLLIISDDATLDDGAIYLEGIDRLKL